MFAVTGATGQLGTFVIESLLERVPANQIIAAVRTPAKASSLIAKGVNVREADYNRPATLSSALAGAHRVLLISGNELGERQAQHRAVILAAKGVGAQSIAYTSLLHADTGNLLLAEDHLATEQDLKASGLAFTLLRNGWYTENQTAGFGAALAQGAMIGASGDGLIAAATRADYAAAAVEVLTGSGHENQIYELAGDIPFTGTQLAAELSKQFGRTIPFHNLPTREYEDILASFLLADLARHIADAESKAPAGALNDDSQTLSRLIGRPTTTLTQAVAAALRSA